MSVEENKALVRRLFEAFNTRNWDVLDELMVPDYVDHNPHITGQKPGREGYREALISGTNTFPDFQLAIEDVIAEGDKVVVRSTASGTHRGEYISILRIVSGKFVEEWANSRE